MKFIETSKAKLPFNTVLFIKDEDGVFHAAKLIKEEKSAIGTLKTFEVAQFSTGEATLGDPVLMTKVTAVAVPSAVEAKPRKAKTK